MNRLKRFAALLMAAVMALFLVACGMLAVEEAPSAAPVPSAAQSAAPTPTPTPTPEPDPEPTPEPDVIAIDPDGYYYDLESVVLYLHTYGELPANFITKNEARDLGWEGGSVERYMDGAAIGGDRFGNREGLLPKANGRTYTECDLYTDGEDSRGAERLVFSNDGLYFYTDDHYETFYEVYVTEEGTVEWK